MHFQRMGEGSKLGLAQNLQMPPRSARILSESSGGDVFGLFGNVFGYKGPTRSRSLGGLDPAFGAQSALNTLDLRLIIGKNGGICPKNPWPSRAGPRRGPDPNQTLPCDGPDS